MRRLRLSARSTAPGHELISRVGEPAAAVDQAHPNVVVAGSNDNIDMEACNAGTDNTCPFTFHAGASASRASTSRTRSARTCARARELALPDIPLRQGNNLNGIAAARGGRTLLAIQSNSGALWRIDARSGRAVRVDVGNADLTNGDGILLAGRTLYVVRNQNNRIVVLRMSRDLRRGTARRTITDPQLDVPTTLARIGRRLFAVNARFGTDAPRTADYWVTRLRR